MKHQLDDVHVTLNGRVIPSTGCSRLAEPIPDAEQPQKSEKYMSGTKIRTLHHLTTPPKDFTRTTPVTGCSGPRIGAIG
jgi:hypothetical protein